jgi:hypothetical protein
MCAGGLTEAGALVLGPGSRTDSIIQIGRGLPKLTTEQASYFKFYLPVPYLLIFSLLMENSSFF